MEQQLNLTRLSKNHFLQITQPYQNGSFNFESHFGTLELNEQNFFMASGPNGIGLALLVRIEEPDSPIANFSYFKQQVHVFKHDGSLLAKFNVPKDEDNVVENMGFLRCGTLCVSYKHGVMLCFTQNGIRVKTVLMRTQKNQDYVLRSSITPHGVAMLFNDLSIAFVDDLSKFVLVKKALKVEVKQAGPQSNYFASSRFS